ncbi:sigma-70 family RNA polymerase sigma factor [Nocardioides sp. WV_118_6]|uniref:RNA polymerase sigma factor n=1 Tax=Pimelobacter TaxID=2044 RepID=UPI001C049255|nr:MULTISPECIES: sigma-70 family RNA polymerase sigma factor [Pimelobacter]UUW90697.1 sigma-70 family RNA polymerase sigma factor [Pimelobacter simplex]UUW94526.1 sigma-70 family RNA polymerase sigma factor [Pimelobacter simplex]
MTGPLSMLVPAAREGDQHAWDTIVDRFLPLVEAIVRRHRLTEADGDDVSQTVWLRLVEHLGDLREPDALPGWIRTTTRNECLRLLAARGRVRPVDPQDDAGLDAVTEDTTDAGLLDAERVHVLAEALAELPAARRELLLLLLADPPVAYEEISRLLGMPIGSIGPTRARALDQLRRTRALRGLGPDLVGRLG